MSRQPLAPQSVATNASKIILINGYNFFLDIRVSSIAEKLVKTVRLHTQMVLSWLSPENENLRSSEIIHNIFIYVKAFLM